MALLEVFFVMVRLLWCWTLLEFALQWFFLPEGEAYGSAVGFHVVDVPFVGDEVHLSPKHDGGSVDQLRVHGPIKAMDVAPPRLFVVCMLGGASQGPQRCNV